MDKQDQAWKQFIEQKEAFRAKRRVIEARYRRKNRRKILRGVIRWQRENRERLAAYHRRAYAKLTAREKAKLLAKIRQYYRRNREKILRAQAARREKNRRAK